jgi:LuxR family maltose regulon positive regulatory protein
MGSTTGRALDPLVATKLRPPRTPQGSVARPRLLERLEPEPERRLTLLSAPAGFGKTTLLGEWAGSGSRGGRPGAGISLDEADNDPVRFLSYLVAASGLRAGRGSAKARSPRYARPSRRGWKPCSAP